jgi:hypothetical protein
MFANGCVVITLIMDNQVNYDDDEDWGKWNVAAKLRILTQPLPTPPMAPYFIEKKNGGSTTTPVSSLSLSNTRTAAAVEPNNRVGASGREVKAREEKIEMNKLVLETPSRDEQTPVSNTDSERTVPMITLEQWDAWNKTHGKGFESSAWATDECADRNPKEGMGNKQKVLQKVAEVFP